MTVTAKINGEVVEMEYRLESEIPADTEAEKIMEAARFNVSMRHTDTGEEWSTMFTASEFEALKNGTLVW